ncbi:MAG: CFI-box-CTERM domain-containing protein [Halobacteriota archaeon]
MNTKKIAVISVFLLFSLCLSLGIPSQAIDYKVTVIAEKPDLFIEAKCEEWVGENSYNVTYVIHNNGTAIAPAGHNTTLIVDGNVVEHKPVPALAPGETYSDTFDTVISCTAGSDIIKVCADNFSVVDELNEDNNCLENEWQCHGCFIATAAYGTPLHEDIDVLRDFRDVYLMTNQIGRAFTDIYYTTSPPIADVIRDNDGLRTIVRKGLVEPLVYLLR